MEENLQETLNECLKGELHAIDNYESVWVLVLWWEDGDYPGFKTEAKEMVELFTTSFNFSVEQFPIPSKRSQLALDGRVSQFLLDHAAEGSLLIIHYGGHGDEDNDRARQRERQSVWAA